MTQIVSTAPVTRARKPLNLRAVLNSDPALAIFAVLSFLAFWERELDGKVHSVRVASARLIKPGTWQHTPMPLHLH